MKNQNQDVMLFRSNQISYGWNWLDDDTFVFDFGDGEFTDSVGNDYFLHFEYHVADSEWVIEIWFEDNILDICELDRCDADVFITEQEIEEIKQFTNQFLQEELDAFQEQETEK